MRSRGLIICLLLLCSFPILAAPADDGFYAIAPSGPAVRTVDGKDIHLGEKLDEKGIRASWLRSESNTNDKFSMSLERNGPFSRSSDEIVLCVSDLCAMFQGSGTNGNQTFSIDTWGFTRAAAEAYARYFGATLSLRSHPGHMLATRFIPTKESFSPGESVPVTLEIRNVGTTPVAFRVGGQNRGARDNQFGFTAYTINAVPDTGSPVHFGGLSNVTELKPGETFKKDVDLRLWFDFKTPGTYSVTGTYQLSFAVPGSSLYFTLWQDYAAAAFQISIK